MWEKFLRWWNDLWSDDDVSWPHAKWDAVAEAYVIDPPDKKAAEPKVVKKDAPKKKKTTKKKASKKQP